MSTTLSSVDPRILLLIEREGADFLLEVTPRTEADRKGGALVERSDRLELLEIAQVDPDAANCSWISTDFRSLIPTTYGWTWTQLRKDWPPVPGPPVDPESQAGLRGECNPA